MKTTGQRYLSGYSDDENQYRALLSSGQAFAERFHIAPGVDLSAEQMAQVTADMVLMVNQTVSLADGSRQVVSVPKLYARVQPDERGREQGSVLPRNAKTPANNNYLETNRYGTDAVNHTPLSA